MRRRLLLLLLSYTNRNTAIIVQQLPSRRFLLLFPLAQVSPFVNSAIAVLFFLTCSFSLFGSRNYNATRADSRIHKEYELMHWLIDQQMTFAPLCTSQSQSCIRDSSVCLLAFVCHPDHYDHHHHQQHHQQCLMPTVPHYH